MSGYNREVEITCKLMKCIYQSNLYLIPRTYLMPHLLVHAKEFLTTTVISLLKMGLYCRFSLLPEVTGGLVCARFWFNISEFFF